MGRISQAPEALPVTTVVLHAREGHHYGFVFTDATRNEALRTMGRFAADPRLNFTWYDAAVLSRRVREACKESL